MITIALHVLNSFSTLESAKGIKTIDAIDHTAPALR